MTEVKTAQPINQVLEKFRRIEHNFNKNFLICLYQVKGIVEDEEDPKDQAQYALLERAYDHWYDKLQADPRCMDACLRFHDSVKEYHDLLLARDTQVFTINGDFFTNIFQDQDFDQHGNPFTVFEKGQTLDTPYLFDSLRDGLDSDCEDLPEEEKDAKDNMWTVIVGLYRLCVLICIYLKMPLVKEIIDMILINNPDLNQSNIFEKIFKEFKGKRRLRKLIMKLLKSKGDNFGDIFNSLQKVISTFSSEVNMDMNMKNNIALAKQKVATMFAEILQKAEVTSLNEEETKQLIEALEEPNPETLNDFVEEKRITQEQLDYIQQLYKEQGLDKMNVTKVVKGLGDTMEKMMSAIESNDEGAMKNILSSAGSGLNLDPNELEKMQAEMEQFGQDDEEEVGDDDEDED